LITVDANNSPATYHRTFRTFIGERMVNIYAA
jgi:hypothetical protein